MSKIIDVFSMELENGRISLGRYIHEAENIPAFVIITERTITEEKQLVVEGGKIEKKDGKIIWKNEMQIGEKAMEQLVFIYLEKFFTPTKSEKIKELNK